MIEEPFHLVLIAYAQLVDHERLIHAQETDARYHLARLIANGFGGGSQVIWDEHEQWRSAVLAVGGPQTAPPTHDDWLARVAAIHRKMQRAGLVPPTSGAVN